MDPVAVTARLGGISRTRQLLAAGCPEAALTRAVRLGTLTRLRNGWYALDPDAPPARAIRAGGRLTGMSALAHLGAWMLDPPRALHVAVPPHASRVARDGVVLHWEPSALGGPGIVSIGDAIGRAVLDEPAERSVPCIDWAFRTGRLDLFEFERLLLRLPRSAQVVREWVDPRSQSVLESVARVRLLRRGWRVRSQVPVRDLDRSDLVIEDRIALELDGREFHADAFERDRRKDLAITLEGRHAIRVSYGMLRTAWPEIERAIEAALRARGTLGNGGVAPPEPRGERRSRR